MPPTRRALLSGLSAFGLAAPALARPAPTAPTTAAPIPPPDRRTLQDVLTATGSPAVGVLLLRGAEVARLEVAGLAATVTSKSVVLSWTYAANDADHYEVWRAADAPYFTPGEICAAPDCATATGTTYTDDSGCSDPDSNCTYVVRVVTTDNWRSTGVRLGVFNFGLTPGE